MNGEGQHTDFWFNPITINNQNLAHLDAMTTDDQGNLTLSGWHATNQAFGRRYHYLIAFDRTTGREIARTRVTAQARNDVARAFPTIANAGQSGFLAGFKLSPQYSRDQIQFVSRWTDDQAGNGNAVDYWFSPVQKINRGWLDNWNVSDGTVHVSGWHADDAALFQPYHFLILYDNTAHRQVAVQKVDNRTSADVARVYGDSYSAHHARFSADFSGVQLYPNHAYSLVSRYSVISTGNGDDGVAADKTDYWYTSESLNQRASHIDGFRTNGHQLTVSGWFADDQSLLDTHPYLIVLNNGHEIGRNALTLTRRPDVARVYPTIYNSLNSGFTTTFTMPDNLSGNLTFVLRFSNDGVHGEGQRDDIWSQNYATNAGWLDGVTTNGDNLTVSGWHVAEAALNKPYSYVFAMDGITGREITRWRVQNQNNRQDVQRAYPWIANSNQSGFTIRVNDDALKGHEVRFMHRYTDDQAGNGNAVDFYDDAMYYFNSDGQKAVNQFVTLIDPTDNYPEGRPHTLYSVYFGGNGQKVYGAHNINGRWYNFQQGSGKLLNFSQRVLDWFRARRHHLTYSQYGSRNGADGTADCSGSMSQALRDAGAGYGALYSTETLHGYLTANGYYLAGQGTGYLQVQYGDIIIWGRRGYSSGDAGHTVAISQYGSGQNILCISTCGYGEDHPGEAVQEYNYYNYWRDDGSPYQYVYRPSNPARA